MATHDVKDLAQALADYADKGDSAQESLERQTIGWTCKNQAYSQTNNAVIASVKNGKSYNVSWVGSATITLKKNSSSGTQIATGDTSPLSFTADADYDLYFGSSAAVTNIMVYDAANKDATFESHHESVDDSFKKIYLNLHEKMPAYVANALPQRHKDISDAYYNGSLKEQIAANDWSEIRPGDIIIGSSTGSKYAMAKANYRIGLGDNTNNTNYPAYGTPHMGMMLVEAKGITEVWAGLPYDGGSGHWSGLNRCPWNTAADVDPTSATAKGSNNTNISRTYNGASVSGYMGSFIRDRIDARLLPDLFQADFGSANVLKYRELHGNAVATDKVSGGQGNWNGCTSAWAWYDRFLDLPSEIELYGSRVFGSGMDHGCQCEQLPLFRTASIYEIFGRIDIWTKAVASSSYAAYRVGIGCASSNGASNAIYACPLACIK